ncbi:MAG: iron-containing redox enzyme family protein [Algicola sp.]|nr:iron-containing redox enzyme family protein [Algicola sp.]
MLTLENFDNRLLDRITEHKLMKYLATDDLTQEQVEFALGQYWYPIHFFPDFLAHVITKSDKLEVKTFVSKVLYQELGEGSLKKSHEVLFTKVLPGFDVSSMAQNEPTQQLMSLFEQSCKSYETGVGFFYATEALDLTIVTGLSVAIKNLRGKSQLPWETIHLVQEPDHTDCVDSIFFNHLNKLEQDRVIEATHDAWIAWDKFFCGIYDGMKNLIKEPCAA